MTAHDVCESSLHEIIGLGTVVVDHLLILPTHPEMDTKTRVIEDRFQVGGPVPTALVLLRRFGWRCSFIGSWAADTFGQMIETDLQREEVSFDHGVCRRTGRTGFAHVWIDQATGSRTIACYRTIDQVTVDDLDERLLRQAKVLHLDGSTGEAALHAAQIVQAHGGQVVLDTGSPKPGMTELIRHVDVLNCPRRFLSQFLARDDVREGIAALLNMGPGTVTVTDGVQGAALGTHDGIIERPAFSIEAVDTTGAGDVFCGALIHGLLNGRRDEDLLTFAMANAAVKCRDLGNRQALPAPDEVEALLDTAFLGQDP